MCVKLPLGDLNPDSFSSHPTSTYTYEVTIALRVCGCLHIISLVLKQCFYAFGFYGGVQDALLPLSERFSMFTRRNLCCKSYVLEGCKSRRNFCYKSCAEREV